MESLNQNLTNRLASLPQRSRFYLRCNGVMLRFGPLPSNGATSDLRFSDRAGKHHKTCPFPTGGAEIVTSCLQWDQTDQLVDWEKLDKWLGAGNPPDYQRCEHGILSRAYLQEVVMVDRKFVYRLSKLVFKEEHNNSDSAKKLLELLQAEHQDWVSFGDFGGIRRSFLKHIHAVFAKGVLVHLPGEELHKLMSIDFLTALTELLAPSPPTVDAWAIYYQSAMKDNLQTTTVVACLTDGSIMSIPGSTAEQVIPDAHVIWTTGYYILFRISFLLHVYWVDRGKTFTTLHSSCGKVQLPVEVDDNFMNAVEKFIRPPMVRGVALDQLVCACYDHKELSVVGKHLDGQLFNVTSFPTVNYAKTQLLKLDTEVTSQFFQAMSVPGKLIIFRKNYLEECTWSLEPQGKGFNLKMGELNLPLLPEQVAPLVTQLPVGQAKASVLDFFAKQ
jgi:hypothetical protein